MIRKLIPTLLPLLLSISIAYAGDGLINVKSSHGVKKTADRLETVLKEKGMTVFATAATSR